MGKRPRISTENLSDLSMITLGDDVVIGGSAHVFRHYGGAGNVEIAPVVIESGATIGEKATGMGDVIVGSGATILPHALLLPGTRVPPRERWGGSPARPISHDEWTSYKRIMRGDGAELVLA
jgi:acetyltransferase-like isoleucine patch superfamily enzyme